MHLSLNELVSEENLKDSLLGLTLVDLFHLMRSERCNFKTLADTIQSNRQLVVQILRKVNSPHFELENPVRDLQHGLAILGIQKLRELILQASPTRINRHYAKVEPHLVELRREAVAVACMAEGMAKLTRQVYSKEFFEAGLKHNLGQVPMLLLLGEDYLKIRSEAESMTYPLYALERDRLGYSHLEVAVEMAWAFNWSDEHRRLVEFLYESPKNEEAWTTRELKILEFVRFAKSLYGGARESRRESFAKIGMQENIPESLKDFSVEQLRQMSLEVEARLKEELRQRGFL